MIKGIDDLYATGLEALFDFLSFFVFLLLSFLLKSRELFGPLLINKGTKLLAKLMNGFLRISVMLTFILDNMPLTIKGNF